MVDWSPVLRPKVDISEGIGAFSKGFLTPYIAGEQLQKAKLNQMRVKQAQQEQTAYNQYQQTGDPKTLMGVNPQMAMQIEEYVRTRPPEEMTKLAQATQYMQMARPYMNQQSWPLIRENLMKIGAPEGMLPPPNANQEQLHQFAWATDYTNAALKMVGKEMKPGTFIQTPSGMQQVPYGEKEKADIREKQAKAAFEEAKAKDPYFGKTPEYIKPVGKEGPIEPHSPGTPVPPGMEFTSSHGRSLTRTMTDENKTALVQGMVEGDIPPSMLSKRAGDYNDVVAEAKRQGVSLTKLQTEYEGAKRFANSLNSQQMLRYRGLAGSVVGTINEVGELSRQMDMGGFTPLNYAEIVTLTKTAGNTPMGQLATRYVTAVNTLKEEFANLAQGGYAPTESVWHLANKQINENFGVKQMGASLDEIKRLVNYRTHAFEELQPLKPGGSKPQQSKEFYDKGYEEAKTWINKNIADPVMKKQRLEALEKKHQENLQGLE